MQVVLEVLAAAVVAIAVAGLSWFGMTMEASAEHPTAVQLIHKTPVAAQSTVSHRSETTIPC
jgi:hypothetical protein